MHHKSFFWFGRKGYSMNELLSLDDIERILETENTHFVLVGNLQDMFI